MHYKILLFLMLICQTLFAGDIAPPLPSKDATIEEQQYLKKIADNINNLTVVTARPNGSRQGRYGDLVGWATSSTIETYICDSSPSGTSWHKIDSKTVASSTTATASAKLVKAWVSFNGVTGAINDSYNVSSIAHPSGGHYTLSWATPFANKWYAIVGSCYLNTDSGFVVIDYNNNPILVNSANIITMNRAGTEKDYSTVTVITVGFQ